MSQSLAKVLYTASATATSGREGRAKSNDGRLDVAVAPPKELGGNGEGTNPEQMFAAGYAACFGSAVLHIARAQKIKAGPVTVTANVAIGPVAERQGFGLAVELVVEAPELPREQAEALVHAAHEVCPYSNATRGNIAVNLRVA